MTTIERERDRWKGEAARLAEADRINGLAIAMLVEQQAAVGEKALSLYAEVRRDAEAQVDRWQNQEIAALKKEVEKWKAYHRELRRRYRVRAKIIRAAFDTLKNIADTAPRD